MEGKTEPDCGIGLRSPICILVLHLRSKDESRATGFESWTHDRGHLDVTKRWRRNYCMASRNMRVHRGLCVSPPLNAIYYTFSSALQREGYVTQPTITPGLHHL
jgi:hypothetical protein